MARHPSREQLIDYLMLKVSQPPPGAPRGPQDAAQQEVSARTAGRPQQKENEHARLTQVRVCVCVFQIRVKVEKNPELGFSISGGVGGRGNPFRPDDNVKTPSFVFRFVEVLF